MRFLIVICLFLAIGCNNTGSKKSASELKSPAMASVKTVAVEFDIHGMTCLGCEQTIQSGISSIKGVQHVKATFKDGKAFVEFIPEIADTTQMKDKIVSSGYVVAGIKSIPLDTLRAKL